MTGSGERRRHRTSAADARLFDDSAADASGLGLSIVREVANLHGGSVSVQSEGPGGGAQFTLELPLVAAARRGQSAS